MEDFVTQLKKEFDSVKKLNWIKSYSNYNNSQGILFEQLIGKCIENFEIPDYQGIEIKTHIKSSNFPITLFNANPDGPFIFTANYLCETYGYPDSILKEKKVLYGTINAYSPEYIGTSYLFKLKVDYKNEQLKLCVYSCEGNLIEDTIFWDFDTLKQKLERKMSYLAVIMAERKKLNNYFYFKFTEINFYKFYDFNNFIELLDKGIIKINFSIGVFRKGKRKGQIHNHGIAFRIDQKYLTKLFSPIS